MSKIPYLYHYLFYFDDRVMQETIDYIKISLRRMFYSVEEAQYLARLILERICGLTPAQQIMCKDKQINKTEKEAIREVEGFFCLMMALYSQAFIQLPHLNDRSP